MWGKLISRVVTSRKMSHTLFIIIFVDLLCASTFLLAGAPDNKGNEFIVAFTKNYNAYRKNVLFVTSSEDANVTFEWQGQIFSRNISAGLLITVEVPLSIRLTSGVENKGILVKSDTEIVVYGLNLEEHTTDGFLALPTDIQNNEYRSACFSILGSYGTNIAVVAKEDDTTVTIEPLSAASVTVTLNRLQTYSLISSTDLTGARITANKTISVFTGNICTKVGGIGACDYLVEQIPPINTWGKRFATVPIAPRTVGDIFRVISSKNDTAVNLHTSDTQYNITLAGQYWQTEIPSTTNEYITCSEPCMVVQYNKGQGSDIYTDPFMMLVPPIEQYASDYILSTSQDANGLSFQNYLSMAIETIQKDQLMIDGNHIDANWTNIPNTTLSATSIALTVGRHNIYHQSPIISFAAYMYGHRSYDSYGYPVGLRLASVAITCQNTSSSPLDGIDNDCDGKIDEELVNDQDDDGDGLVDEDIGAVPPVISAPISVNTNNYSNSTSTSGITIKVCNFSQAQRIGQVGIKESSICLKLGITVVNLTEQEVIQSACKKWLQQTWVIIDGCKNIITYKQNVTAEIEEPQVILDTVAVACTSFNASDENSPLQNIKPSITRCQNDTSISEITPQSLLTGECQGQTITRTWEIQNTCGQVIVVLQNITVINEVVVSGFNSTSMIKVCNFSQAQRIGQVGIQESNNCPILGITVVNLTEQEVIQSACKKWLQQTWTIEDGCKNIITYKQNVTAEIEEPQVILDSEHIFYCTYAEALKIELQNVGPNITTCDVSIKEITLEDLVVGRCTGQTIQRTWEIKNSCGQAKVVTQAVTFNREERTVCQSSPCQNGSCIEVAAGYYCRCNPGYVGTHCNIDECRGILCENGVCSDLVDGYSCICFSGYTGTNCHTELIHQSEKETSTAKQSSDTSVATTTIVGIAVAGTVVVGIIATIAVGIKVKLSSTVTRIGTAMPTQVQTVQTMPTQVQTVQTMPMQVQTMPMQVQTMQSVQTVTTSIITR